MISRLIISVSVKVSLFVLIICIMDIFFGFIVFGFIVVILCLG